MKGTTQDGRDIFDGGIRTELQSTLILITDYTLYSSKDIFK